MRWNRCPRSMLLAPAWALAMVLALALIACRSEPDRFSTLGLSAIDYPEARRVDVVDTYYDVEVADPYRWLEDEASQESQIWLAAQDRITETFFSELPSRQCFVEYLERSWLEGAVGVPIRRGNRSFFWQSPEGQSHPILLQAEALPATADMSQTFEVKTVFDLNQRDPDGRLSTLPITTVSPSGRYLTYELHLDGADLAEHRIFDTASWQELDEVLPRAFGAVSGFTADETGLVYTAIEYDTMLGNEAAREPGVYLHRLGTPVSEDRLLYLRSWDGMFMAVATPARNGRDLWLLDMNVMGARGSWGVRTLEPDSNETRWLTSTGSSEAETDFRFAFVGEYEGPDGPELLLLTDYLAPNWRIVASNPQRPGRDNLREVVPEQEMPISMVAGSNGGLVVLAEDAGKPVLVVTYIRDNAHVVEIFALDGGSRSTSIELPFAGSVTRIEPSPSDNSLLIGLESFLVPHRVYRYDFESQQLTLADGPWHDASAAPQFDDFEVSSLFYDSYDGTRIPMTVLSRTGTKRGGNNKVLLYGYGGWGIPTLPSFANRIHAWLEQGGVYAIANLRGGGEYGVEWHDAGRLTRKQNVFDDFAAAAEFLVAKGWTQHSKIAIVGASNGGLLTAASYNQRPELFGAVISEVAAIDLLRLPDTTVGGTLTMELGAPATSREVFDYLLGYSPLHNLREKGPFPPILHIVGENDPRCKPGHIYKYVADMQRWPADQRLSILRVVRGAGHGSERKEDLVTWHADELSFAWDMTD